MKNEDKKAKGTKKYIIKRKLKSKNYKNCLEATQLENKINYLEKNKNDVDSIKEFIKNKSILKIQQRFKSKIHNFFTEEFNKITLSSNNDKRMQLIDLIETYAYATSEEVVTDKGDIKCSNIIKWYKKSLTLMMILKNKT